MDWKFKIHGFQGLKLDIEVFFGLILNAKNKRCGSGQLPLSTSLLLYFKAVLPQSN
jgi:hypothetical protein